MVGTNSAQHILFFILFFLILGTGWTRPSQLLFFSSFMKSTLGKILGFGRTHETKYLFLLLKREIDFKVLDIFF